MTRATPAAIEPAPTCRFVRWTAFAAVFIALLMPLGVTMASGTTSGKSPATPKTRSAPDRSADHEGLPAPSLEVDHVGAEDQRLL